MTKSEAALQEQYDAVILGGGRAPWLLPLAGTDVRCLARLDGVRLLDYVAAALRASGRIRRMLLAVDADVAVKMQQMQQAGEVAQDIEICTGGANLPETCLLAAQKLGRRQKILFICDDIPLVSGDAIDDFLSRCEKFPLGELYYPVIRRETCLRAYPEAKRTFGTLRDGSFTGGNMMLVASWVIPRGQKKAKEIFARRKNPLALCRWLGWSFIFKLLLRRLDTQQAQARVCQLMEMDSRLIISDYAAVGMDIDKPEDLALAAEAVRKLPR